MACARVEFSSCGRFWRDRAMMLGACLEGTEMGESLDRLMRRSILTKTDGVMGSYPNDTDLRQGRKTNCTSSIGNEVQEGSSIWNDSTICGKTVHDSTHCVLADTISDVTSGPVTDLKGGWLEVNSVFPSGQVGTGQICRTANQLWDRLVNLGENDLRKLSRSNCSIRWRVNWEVLFPALWKVACQTTLQIRGLGLELLAVFLEKLLPLLLLCCPFSAVLVV